LFISALFFALGDAGKFRNFSLFLPENAVKTARFKFSGFPGHPSIFQLFQSKKFTFKVPYFSHFFELLFHKKILNEKRREKQ
jgi:hypothetical protein